MDNYHQPNKNNATEKKKEKKKKKKRKEKKKKTRLNDRNVNKLKNNIDEGNSVLKKTKLEDLVVIFEN